MDSYDWVYHLGLLLANYFNSWFINTMRILSWNVRVAGQKDFKQELKALIQSHDPDILILMKTRINVGKALLIFEISQF